MKHTWLMAALLWGCSDDAKPKPTDTPGFPIVEALPGTCGTLAEDDVTRNRFVAGSCVQEHVSEVAGSYDLSDEPTQGVYPGQSELRLETQIGCRPFFEQYVGKSYWESTFELMAIPPSKSAWEVGERKVICLVVGKDGAMLEGTARASKR
jgi:hypothetical protein